MKDEGKALSFMASSISDEGNTIIIFFERSGGFAGLRIKTKIDTDAISEELAQEILKWVQEADFFSLPATMPVPASGADRFQYNLTIEEGGQKHSVVLYESADISEPLKLLIKQLMDIARKNPSS